MAANGNELENEGERRILMTDALGNRRPMTFQITNVNKVLCSVGEICQSSQIVVFNPPRHAGDNYILDLQSWLRTPLREEGGAYRMDVWVSPYNDALTLGFPSQQS